MSDKNLLPNAFTAPISARLLKTTPDLLAELTAAGGIAALPGEGWRRYAREEIEGVLGRALTVEEWAEAERAQDARRAANQRYNRKRRAGTASAKVAA